MKERGLSERKTGPLKRNIACLAFFFVSGVLKF